MKEPSLVKATDLAPEDLGSLVWDPAHNSDVLSVSREGSTILWGPKKAEYQGYYPPAFVPARTLAHLHSGAFRWDFLIEEMATTQIGVGFMLQWEGGLLDWGFFGYLGAGSTAWAYDPSTGDVVSETRSIFGGLPKIEDGHSGIVSVMLDVPRERKGTASFSIHGVVTPSIDLPVSSVMVPAACFLAERQKVTLGGLAR